MPRYLQRHGLPRISLPMLQVLRQLVEAATEHRALELHLHASTRRALIERDWICTVHKAFGTEAYACTERGKRAYRIYTDDRRGYRHDGLCPNCGLQPRQIAPSGRTRPYCVSCEQDYKRRQIQLRRDRLSKDRPCQCGQPRHITASGRVKNYCLHCLRNKAVHHQRAYNQRQLHNPTLPPCSQCGLRPRQIRGNSVSCYCSECLRLKRQTYYRQRKVKI